LLLERKCMSTDRILATGGERGEKLAVSSTNTKTTKTLRSMSAAAAESLYLQTRGRYVAGINQ